jgi:hypothetical protein
VAAHPTPQKMSGCNLDNFHIEYVSSLVSSAAKVSPAVQAAYEDTSEPGSECGEGTYVPNGGSYQPPIEIMTVQSIRLYRCHNHKDYNNNALADRVAKSHDGIDHETHQQLRCRCYCCRSPSSSVGTPFQRRKMLAVLVPPSLTHSFINSMQPETSSGKSDESQDMQKEGRTSRQIQIDAELELRRSIHPCLCSEDPSIPIGNASHSKDQRVERCPQLLILGIISFEVSQSAHHPADIILFGLVTEYSTSALKHNNMSQDDILSEYSLALNHETASNVPWSVMKAFPVCSISAVSESTTTNLELTGLKAGSFDTTYTSTSMSNENLNSKADLPCCPVCLNRIDPVRLGLPALKDDHKCSRWCSTSITFHDEGKKQYSCVNKMKFDPWTPPAQCLACQVIAQKDISDESEMSSALYRRSATVSLASVDQSPSLFAAPALRPSIQRCNSEDILTLHNSDTSNPLKCHQCAMTTTLWVCLTCGTVGCGRYTLKHAAEHNTNSNHPYSLELATGRIWDYENGTFVHRKDLMECPVMSMTWGNTRIGLSEVVHSSPAPMIASSSSMSSHPGGSHSFAENQHEQWTKGNSSYEDGNSGLSSLNIEDESPSCRNALARGSVSATALAVGDKLISPPPKKSMMISQEYEALLQSALEDQAQHYEGEITRLRADLASSRMQNIQHMSDRETREIQALRKDSERLRNDLDHLTSALVGVQTEEAKQRSLSQRMLREQSIAKELLEKLRSETRIENKTCRQRMDDLDLQIADLKANLRVRYEIAKDEELSQAQIFGTAGGDKESGSGKKKGKKSRFGRKK